MIHEKQMHFKCYNHMVILLLYMLHYCIVPMCKNHSGMKEISFHRLPLNNKQLLKQWICKIRRENIPLNKYSRVCSVHFEGGKKKGPKDVPTIFAWTPST